MLTFGVVSSKVCITYSRCPGNNHVQNVETIEDNRQSTKQFLKNS